MTEKPSSLLAKNAEADTSSAPAATAEYVQRLYVTGQTPRSVLAIENMRRICAEHLSGRYTLEVIDIYQHPEACQEQQIIAAPTVIKVLPLPLRRIIGDLSDTQKVLIGLDLRPARTQREGSRTDRAHAAGLGLPTAEGHRGEIDDLRARLREGEETKKAIRSGEVDAVGRQFRGFLEASSDAVIVVDQTGRINFANNRIEAMFGHLPDELVGKPLSVLMPERYRDLHAGHLDRFMNDPRPRMMGAGLELRALRKDGSEFPTEISLSPGRTSDGLVVIAAIRDITVKSLKKDALEAENVGLHDLLTQAGIDAARLLAQAGIDATENEAAKRLQRLLLEEMFHRVKNTLATVIGITSQSLRTAKNLEQGRLAVESRLVALGRAHDLLLRANWASAKLTDVIRAAIEPFDSHDVRRFVVQDTSIEIGPGAVLPLTMSLNELCTNAVKYGALSNATGRIDITSTVDEKAQLFKLTWTEKGGPEVQEPTRRSFGTRLIAGLADQLHGDVRLRYEPEGVVYELLASFRQDEDTAKIEAVTIDLVARIASLSPRERQVLDGLVAGRPNKLIARDFDISPRTIEVYRANVMTKMQAGSVSELVRLAIRAGLASALVS
jgi:PAS domain S-box-containing protein